MQGGVVFYGDTKKETRSGACAPGCRQKANRYGRGGARDRAQFPLRCGLLPVAAVWGRSGFLRIRRCRLRWRGRLPVRRLRAGGLSPGWCWRAAGGGGNCWPGWAAAGFTAPACCFPSLAAGGRPAAGGRVNCRCWRLFCWAVRQAGPRRRCVTRPGRGRSPDARRKKRRPCRCGGPPPPQRLRKAPGRRRRGARLARRAADRGGGMRRVGFRPGALDIWRSLWPGTWAGCWPGGWVVSELGKDLAAYYMDGTHYTAFSAVFLGLYSGAFLQLSAVALCGFRRLGRRFPGRVFCAQRRCFRPLRGRRLCPRRRARPWSFTG